MTALAAARTLLFAPGDDEHKLRKALESGADAVVADLEDGVPAERKQLARETLLRVLGDPAPCARLIRVASADDLAVVDELRPDAVVVPKATFETVAGLHAGAPVVALVETAAGLRDAFAVAALAQVEALMLGTLDLAAELRIDPVNRPALRYARSHVVVASAAAGIRAPFDGVHTAIGDADGLRAEAAEARALGFGGKACIHPAQLATVAAAFAPEPAEVEWARAVLAAFAEAGGAVASLDGEMIDRPVVARAQGILDHAEGSDA